MKYMNYTHTYSSTTYIAAAARTAYRTAGPYRMFELTTIYTVLAIAGTYRIPHGISVCILYFQSIPPNQVAIHFHRIPNDSPVYHPGYGVYVYTTCTPPEVIPQNQHTTDRTANYTRTAVSLQ